MKFVKCKKTHHYRNGEEAYTENQYYELRLEKNYNGEIEINVITNSKLQLIIGVKGVREDFFKEYFSTLEELRKIKINKLLNSK